MGGIDLNRPRMRNALRAVQALAVAPNGFSAALFSDKVHSLTGLTEADYTTRQAAYDLRKLRAKGLISKPGSSRRYLVPATGARTISALLTLRDQVLRSWPPSWPAFAAHTEDGSLQSGPLSMVTTRSSGSTWRPCSTIWGSPPPHRQFVADRRSASA